MSPITTHILDTTLGIPARGVPIQLFKLDGAGGTLVIWFCIIPPAAAIGKLPTAPTILFGVSASCLAFSK